MAIMFEEGARRQEGLTKGKASDYVGDGKGERYFYLLTCLPFRADVWVRYQLCTSKSIFAEKPHE